MAGSAVGCHACFSSSRMVDVSVTYHTVTVPFAFVQVLLGGHVARAVAAGTIADDEADRWWTRSGTGQPRGHVFVWLHGIHRRRPNPDNLAAPESVLDLRKGIRKVTRWHCQVNENRRPTPSS